MRYTHLRGLAKVKAQTLPVFACMNLKKLARWKYKKGWLDNFLICFGGNIMTLVFRYKKPSLNRYA